MKCSKKAMVASFVLFATLTGAAAQASAPKQTSQAEESVSAKATNNRELRRLGAYVGILGDPHPTGIGLNIAYNVLKFMRASIGFGKVSTASVSLDGSGIAAVEESQTTIGFATKWMMPDWNLTPAVTLGYSHVSLSDGMVFADYKASNIYTGLGVDWQAESGFNLGAGLNLSLNGGAPTAPYINVGMFF